MGADKGFIFEYSFVLGFVSRGPMGLCGCAHVLDVVRTEAKALRRQI